MLIELFHCSTVHRHQHIAALEAIPLAPKSRAPSTGLDAMDSGAVLDTVVLPGGMPAKPQPVTAQPRPPSAPAELLCGIRQEQFQPPTGSVQDVQAPKPTLSPKDSSTAGDMSCR